MNHAHHNTHATVWVEILTYPVVKDLPSSLAAITCVTAAFLRGREV